MKQPAGNAGSRALSLRDKAGLSCFAISKPTLQHGRMNTRTQPMNRQFFEFWGNYFTHVAKGQKQIEEMTAWMNKGFSGTDDLTKLFRRCYGLDDPEAGSDLASRKWQQAIADFQKTFSQTADAWGWVTKAEHQRALDRCAALEETVRQQQTTVSQLRELLNQEGLGHTELFQHFKNVYEDQSKQFHDLMKSMNKAVKDKS